MAIFDGIAILSDMDGTLLNNRILHKEQLKALRYFTENGGLFCPATGRAESFLFKNYPELPLNSYCIVKNGTAIYDTSSKTYIWKHPLDRQALYRLEHLLQQFDTITKVAFHTEYEYFDFDVDQPNLKEKIWGIDAPLFKIVLAVKPPFAHDIAKYCEQFDDYQHFCSSDFLFEIIPLQTGKGVCTQKLRDFFPPNTTIIGIGDYENDISLLQAADIGVAVSGGYEPLKNHARWIAPPIEEHPVAWLVNYLEKEGIYRI